tara:strand:- start:71 stop:595 length:525 start_codon:yes stop_codon:yes gene_type:complete
MEKCYRVQEYKPPVLSFDLFEKIGIHVEVARHKHKFNQVLTIIDSVNNSQDNIWKEVVCCAHDFASEYLCHEDNEYLEIKSMSLVERVTYIYERSDSMEMSRVFVNYLNDKWGQSIWFNKQYSDYEITWAWEGHDPNSGRCCDCSGRKHLPPNIYYYTPEFKDYVWSKELLGQE